MRACRVFRAIPATKPTTAILCSVTPQLAWKHIGALNSLSLLNTSCHSRISPRTNSSRSLSMASNGEGPSNGTPQHQTLDRLTQTLSKFGVTEVSQFPNAYPAFNPVDIYRAHITDLLQPITGADPKVIYQAIQWTQTLDKGDCVLPVPALRLKGKKPDEIAKKILEEVCSNIAADIFVCTRNFARTHIRVLTFLHVSFQNHL